jgi:hypothetical protein
MNSPLHIKEVTTKTDLKKFVEVPWMIFKDDPNWVPPLKMERTELLTKGKNAYFEHAVAQYWLAYNGNVIVGRISAQIDDLVEKYHNLKTGHFGFFECINDQEVANLLLDTATSWLKERGRDEILGPFNLSINEETGLLVGGFDTPPSLLMGHALPYFENLLVDYGLKAVKDTWAYRLNIVETGNPPAIQKLVDLTFAKPNINIRPINMKNYEKDMKTIMSIFNDAWVDNWKYLPFTDAELSQNIKDMKLLLRPDFTYIAEVDGVAQAMMVTLPNLNEIIKDLDGKLMPTGLFKLLWRLKIKPSYKSVRVPLMGVRTAHQNTRLGAALAFGLFEKTRLLVASTGVTEAELSWVLEENTRLSKMLETIGCVKYKTYRIFSKEL